MSGPRGGDPGVEARCAPQERRGDSDRNGEERLDQEPPPWSPDDRSLPRRDLDPTLPDVVHPVRPDAAAREDDRGELALVLVILLLLTVWGLFLRSTRRRRS